jgi:Rrf2 family protein
MLGSVSRKCEYALKAMLALALRDDGEAISSHRIAGRHALPQRFVEVILSELRQGGFVESRRGSSGGYVLAKPPEDIALGELISFVEGWQNGGGSSPTRKDPDVLSILWHTVDAAVADVLFTTTLADLAAQHRRNQEDYVPNYAI